MRLPRPVHAQLALASASSIATSSCAQPRRSRCTAVTASPPTQRAQRVFRSTRNASTTVRARGHAPRSSAVSNADPSRTLENGSVHDAMSSPSTRIRHAPHVPLSHPWSTLFRCSSRRNTASSRSVSGARISRTSPLTMSCRKRRNPPSASVDAASGGRFSNGALEVTR